MGISRRHWIFSMSHIVYILSKWNCFTPSWNSPETGQVYWGMQWKLCCFPIPEQRTSIIFFACNKFHIYMYNTQTHMHHTHTHRHTQTQMPIGIHNAPLLTILHRHAFSLAYTHTCTHQDRLTRMITGLLRYTLTNMQTHTYSLGYTETHAHHGRQRYMFTGIHKNTRPLVYRESTLHWHTQMFTSIHKHTVLFFPNPKPMLNSFYINSPAHYDIQTHMLTGIRISTCRLLV